MLGIDRHDGGRPVQQQHILPADTSDPGPRGLAWGAAGSAAGTVGFAGECQLLRLISSDRLTLRLCAGPTS